MPPLSPLSPLSPPPRPLPPAYVLRQGVPSDCPFLGRCILEAERDLHGRGIWDVYTGWGGEDRQGRHTQRAVDSDSTEVVRAALSFVALDSASTCLYNHGNFTVVAVTSTNEPVAAACSFLYPESSIADAFKYISLHMKAVHGWTQQDATAAESRLSWLDASYPTAVAYEGRWMVEGVHTHPDHRRKGLASHAVHAAAERGRERGAKECLIAVSVGNVPARSCYERMGFSKVGTEVPRCEECMDAVGCWGFEVCSAALGSLNSLNRLNEPAVVGR